MSSMHSFPHWRIAPVVCLALLAALQASGQVFVVPGGAGAADGTSWTNAYGDLAAALADARAAAEDVWVAAGTYQVRSLEWPTEVAGYGGFAGLESALSERNVTANETILDAGGAERAVFVMNGATNTRIDGFTIKNAIMAGGGPHVTFAGSALTYNGVDGTNTVANCHIVDNGPGGHGNVFLQLSHIHFLNCVFENNQGTGVSVCILVNDGSQPLIEDCVFRNNGGDANSHHGALAVRAADSHPTVVNSLFENNTALGGSGGGLSIQEGGAATIIGCDFVGNAASHGGAIADWAGNGSMVIERCRFLDNTTLGGGHGAAIAVHSTTSTVDITNCLFHGNVSTGIGNGVFAWVSTSVTTISYCSFSQNAGAEDVIRADGDPHIDVENCVVWDNGLGLVRGNVTVANSIVQGGHLGGTNADPLFADAPGGDLRLMPGSPAINAATGTPPATDILGVERPQGAAAELGAYEYIPFAITMDAPNMVIIGDDVTLSFGMGTVYDTLTPASYQWYYNGQIMQGENGPSLSLTDVGFDASGQYTLVVNIAGQEYTASYNMNVSPPVPAASVFGLLLAVLALAGLGGALALRRTQSTQS